MNTFAHRRRLLVAGAVTVLLTAGCGTTITPAGPVTPPAKATATVRVYFHKGSGDGRLAPVTRTVPRTRDLPAAAMSQLLAGPTSAERHAGYWSWFSAKTAGMVLSVRIHHHVGYADFQDFSTIIPNASSSAGSAALLAELDHTLMQFPGVRSAMYSFNGNAETFYSWLQRGVPAPVPPQPATTTVTVYFHKKAPGTDGILTGLTRTVPATSHRPAAAMSQLLAGPTAAERKAGYFSWFSGKTAGMLRSVHIAHGAGYADFRDFRLIISGASSSAGSALLLDQLDHTLMQFPGVTETVYSFNGNVTDFYAWLQRSAPNVEPPGTAHAVDAARAFLLHIGMRAMVTGTVQWAGPAGGSEVDAQFRSDSGTGAVTTVRVQRQPDGSWVPLSAQTPLIVVTRPAPRQAVSSPVTIAGRSGTWEGQLLASIRHYSQQAMTELGHNNAITGGATGMAPFSGQITFQAPPAGGVTWLVITYQSAKTGALAGVTAVPVTAG